MQTQEEIKRKEKIKQLEGYYNERTGNFDIPCKCGKIFKLNHKQVWLVNMHKLKCNKCNSIIIK